MPAALTVKRILIVGGGGVIGAALIEQYVRRNTEVVASSRAQQNIHPCEHVERIVIDLERPETFQSVFGHFDAAFFCAAVTSISRCEEEQNKTFDINVRSTVRLMEIMSKHTDRIIFLSSSTVFGLDALQRFENSVTGRSLYSYGRQKAAVEKKLLELMPGSTVVRITKVLSGKMPLIRKFDLELAEGKECHPFSNLYMCPVSLRYAVDSLVKIEESALPGIFHISGDAVVSYFQFLKTYATHNKYSIERVVDSKMNDDAIPSPAHSRNYAMLDMCRTTELLGIAPQPLAGVLEDIKSC